MLVKKKFYVDSKINIENDEFLYRFQNQHKKYIFIMILIIIQIKSVIFYIDYI